MYTLEDAIAALPVAPDYKTVRLMSKTDLEFRPDLQSKKMVMGQALMNTCGDCLEGVGNSELDPRHSGFPVESVARASLVPAQYQGTVDNSGSFAAAILAQKPVEHVRKAKFM